jgi:hypothetical protein
MKSGGVYEIWLFLVMLRASEAAIGEVESPGASAGQALERDGRAAKGEDGGPRALGRDGGAAKGGVGGPVASTYGALKRDDFFIRDARYTWPSRHESFQWQKSLLEKKGHSRR